MSAYTPPEGLAKFDWEATLVANESRSRVVAWRVAAGSAVISVCLAMTVLTLVPLHTVVPYVVTVDKATGETSMLTGAAPAAGANELNDKHWISEFVIARERYSYRLLQTDYDNVSRFSSPKVWAPYSALYSGDAPLDKKLGDTTELIPSIINITLSEPGLATVRLQVTTHLPSGDIKNQRYLATLRFDYKPPQRAPESQLVANPFGFVVTAYRLDEELTQ